MISLHAIPEGGIREQLHHICIEARRLTLLQHRRAPMQKLVDIAHRDRLVCVLALLLRQRCAILPLQDLLAILVQLQLCDYAVGRVHPNIHL